MVNYLKYFYERQQSALEQISFGYPWETWRKLSKNTELRFSEPQHLHRESENKGFISQSYWKG